MRVLGSALAGMLAAATPGLTNPLPSKMERASKTPGVVQVWDGDRSGRHHVPSGAAGGWHGAPGHTPEWKGGWVPRHWRPYGYFGGWGPYGGLGVPPYWVWGPGGGGFDYPFSDWRGPMGGWGNP
jgi:hypothetical protein